ncbi:MAG: hypothetical protein V4509_03300 [Patescibacteria group bacterium]
MADDKKKKPAEESHGGGNLFVDAIFWFLLVLVVFAAIKGSLSSMGFSLDIFPSLASLFASIFNTVQVFSIFISLLFVVGIIYYNIKLGELMHHGHGHGHGDNGHGELHGAHAVAVPHAPDKRWLSIQDHLHSHNESDWRLAIIESDIVLSEMLGRMGYVGSTIADKLKMVEKSDFNTIDDAWEAHKVRNRIAHDGATFKLPQHEAERVVGLYQKVFEEFHFI